MALSSLEDYQDDLRGSEVGSWATDAIILADYYEVVDLTAVGIAVVVAVAVAIAMVVVVVVAAVAAAGTLVAAVAVAAVVAVAWEFDAAIFETRV